MYSECITHMAVSKLHLRRSRRGPPARKMSLHPNKTDVSLNVHYIKNMFTALFCYQTAFSVGKEVLLLVVSIALAHQRPWTKTAILPDSTQELLVSCCLDQ